MVNNTKNIEPLRIDQQWQKIRLFAERNKNYFNTLTVPEKEEKITQPYPIYIIANKTSKEQVPVLQKISEFIRLLPP